MIHLFNYIWLYCKRKGNRDEIISKVMMKVKESLTYLYARRGTPGISPELNSWNSAEGIQQQQQQQQQWARTREKPVVASAREAILGI